MVTGVVPNVASADDDGTVVVTPRAVAQAVNRSEGVVDAAVGPDVVVVQEGTATGGGGGGVAVRADDQSCWKGTVEWSPPVVVGAPPAPGRPGRPVAAAKSWATFIHGCCC